MSILQAIFLSLIQGLAEFFPVSSSAHLKIARSLFHIDIPNPLLFDLTVHLGTMAAAIIFLRKDIVHLFTKNKKELLFIACAIMPLIPIYFFLKPIFSILTPFFAFFMILSGLLLLFSSHVNLKMQNYSQSRLKDVIFIGLLQALALLPGFSRSGSTISAAFMRGWKYQDAIKFSFLLAIPTVMGGEVLELFKHFSSHAMTSLPFSIYMLSFSISFLVGFFAIKILFSFTDRKNLYPFAIYCLTVGIICFICFNILKI